MPERRYDDREIAAIFRTAADAPQAPAREVAPEEGLTLKDLQAIGREVGIAPAAVERAALALEVRSAAVARTVFGLPLGVARTVDLNRRLSDDEWERLVVQLREVFRARGATRSDGSLRQWTNGNLQVLLEPTERGHRLRFGTMHGAARAMMGAGTMAIGVGTVVAIATAVTGHFFDSLPGIAFLGVAGLGMIAGGALRLPRWARIRSRQMEALAAQVAAPPVSTTPPPSLPPE